MSDTIDDGTADLAVLDQVFGLRLVCYLCARDEESIIQHLSSQPPRNASLPWQAVLTETLLPWARELIQRDAFGRTHELQLRLGYSPDGRNVLGTLLRLSAGGSLEASPVEKDSQDPVETTLVSMAIDAYPMLLAPSAEGLLRSPRISLFQHPARDALVQAVRSDEALSSLYPSDGFTESVGRTGYLVDTMGYGGSIQEVSFPESIISSAWDIVRRRQEFPTMPNLIQETIANLWRIREAARGGLPKVPVRMAFTGFRIPDGATVSTPWGPIRPIHPWESKFSPELLHGGIIQMDTDTDEIAVSYAGDVVLELSQPYGVTISEWPSQEEHDPRWFADQRRKLGKSPDHSRTAEVIELALLLGVEGSHGRWVTGRVSWIWQSQPLQPEGHLSWGEVKNFSPHALSDDECERFASWISLIDEQWTDTSIDIAVKRFLSAANTRTDPADRLVDSVIVWENLFGSDDNGITLRLSGSIAWLLGRTFDDRRRIKKEVGELYAQRSRIVHGSSGPRRKKKSANATAAELSSQLYGDATRALEISRQCLRALMKEQPDILAESDGGSRSTSLLLGKTMSAQENVD